jgi:hypothetical protein
LAVHRHHIFPASQLLCPTTNLQQPSRYLKTRARNRHQYLERPQYITVQKPVPCQKCPAVVRLLSPMLLQKCLGLFQIPKHVLLPLPSWSASDNFFGWIVYHPSIPPFVLYRCDVVVPHPTTAYLFNLHRDQPLPERETSRISQLLFVWVSSVCAIRSKFTRFAPVRGPAISCQKLRSKRCARTCQASYAFTVPFGLTSRVRNKSTRATGCERSPLLNYESVNDAPAPGAPLPARISCQVSLKSEIISCTVQLSRT